MRQIQQGDVLFQAVSIPEDAMIVTDSKGIIVAEGELTGHAHMVKERAQLLKHGDVMFLRVPKEVTIVHQEHGNVVLPVGEYRVGRVQEYDHLAEMARQVRD